MFKLVALIFALTANGQPADEPSAAMSNKTLFPTKEACMNYLDDEPGSIAAKMLQQQAAAHNSVVKFVCVQADGKGEDGKI